MKSTKITTLNSQATILNQRGVKAQDYNELKDDFDALRPSDTELTGDTISEVTAGAGVTVDGVVLKDNAVTATGGITNGTSKVVTKVAEVAVSAAELNGMFVTPKELVAAPGAGFALSFIRAVLIYDDGGTDFAAGGVIHINYGSGGAIQSSNLAASFLTANGDKVFNMEKLNAASGLTMPVNVSLVLTNTTQAFTTGVGVVRVQIEYSIHETGL